MLILSAVIAAAHPALGGVRRLSPDSMAHGVPHINRSGQVVWLGADTHVYFWNGSVAVKLTSNTALKRFPQISDGGHVVWLGTGEADAGVFGPQVFLWYDAGLRQLTYTRQDKGAPHLNSAGQVVWTGVNNGTREVYLWDGASVHQISRNNGDSYDPQINAAGQIVWWGGPDWGQNIHFWNGSRVWHTSGDQPGGVLPRINRSGQTVWATSGGYNTEIYLMDGPLIQQLTHNESEDSAPEINDSGQVVWWGRAADAWQLFFWDGSTTHQITRNHTNGHMNVLHASLNGAGQVVWQGHDGTDWEIYLWDRTTIRQLTDNRVDDMAPELNNAGQVVWCTREGERAGIYLYSPVGVSAVSLVSDSVIGTRSITGAVYLSHPAPTGGAVVTLTSDRPDVAAVPEHVIVPAGDSTAIFSMNTTPVKSATEVVISATQDGDANSVVLTVLPHAVASLALEPARVFGGRTSLGTVTLSDPAPAGGTVVTLTSADLSLVTVPASVQVQAGATTATFPVSTSAVTARVSVPISAAAGGVTLTTLLTVSRSDEGTFLDEIHEISLVANDILYDPFSRRIYASVPGGAGTAGNSVTVIDPATRAIGASVFVGSEPGQLAISDNGQYL
jgi:YVTN family beta-propeller protein